MRICPICKATYDEYPAISRRDNKTEICPICGIDEALEDFAKAYCSAPKKERKKMAEVLK